MKTQNEIDFQSFQSINNEIHTNLDDLKQTPFFHPKRRIICNKNLIDASQLFKF